MKNWKPDCKFNSLSIYTRPLFAFEATKNAICYSPFARSMRCWINTKQGVLCLCDKRDAKKIDFKQIVYKWETINWKTEDDAFWRILCFAASPHRQPHPHDLLFVVFRSENLSEWFRPDSSAVKDRPQPQFAIGLLRCRFWFSLRSFWFILSHDWITWRMFCAATVLKIQNGRRRHRVYARHQTHSMHVLMYTIWCFFVSKAKSPMNS